MDFIKNNNIEVKDVIIEGNILENQKSYLKDIERIRNSTITYSELYLAFLSMHLITNRGIKHQYDGVINTYYSYNPKLKLKIIIKTLGVDYQNYWDLKEETIIEQVGFEANAICKNCDDRRIKLYSDDFELGSIIDVKCHGCGSISQFYVLDCDNYFFLEEKEFIDSLIDEFRVLKYLPHFRLLLFKEILPKYRAYFDRVSVYHSNIYISISFDNHNSTEKICLNWDIQDNIFTYSLNGKVLFDIPTLREEVLSIMRRVVYEREC